MHCYWINSHLVFQSIYSIFLFLGQAEFNKHQAKKGTETFSGCYILFALTGTS